MDFDRLVLETFLREQERLFPEPVAETEEDAESYLEENAAAVCESLEDVRSCLEEAGMDVSDLDDEDLEEAEEVFPIPDGRYLVLLG